MPRWPILLLHEQNERHHQAVVFDVLGALAALGIWRPVSATRMRRRRTAGIGMVWRGSRRSCRTLNVVQLSLALEQAIRRFQPAIVHCWSEPSSVIGGLVAASLGVPRIVIQLVNVSPLRQNLPGAALYYDAYRMLLSKPNVRLLNISVANARNLEQWLEIPCGTVKLLRNGFVPDSIRIRTQEEARSCREGLGIPRDAPTVGAVMRFAPEKDPDLWLQAARLIAADRPDVWFVLAGYGALAEHVDFKLKQMGLSQRVSCSAPPSTSAPLMPASTCS